MVYIFTFLISTLLLAIAGRCRGGLCTVLICLAVAPLCALAGLRGDDVGTDVSVYGIEMFTLAQGASLPEYLDAVKNANVPAYAIYVWLITSLFDNRIMYFACIEALILVPVVVRLKQENARTMWLGFVLYLLIFYPLSLNMMKQSVAVSFVFFAGKYALEGRPFKYFSVVILAGLFHLTAFCALAFYPLVRLIMRSRYNSPLSAFDEKRFNLAHVAWGGLIICSILLFSCGESLVRSLSSLRSAYSYQAAHIGEGDYNLAIVVLWLMTAAIYYSYSREIKRSETATKRLAAMFVLSTVGCILMQLDVVSDSVGRMGYYGLIFCPLLFESLFSERQTRVAISVPICYSMIYFTYTTILMQYNEVYPYTLVLFGS